MSRIVILVVLLIAIPSADAAATDEVPGYRVDSLQVRDQVGDPIVDSELVHSRIESVLGSQYLLQYRGSGSQSPEFSSNGYDRIRNLFSLEASDSAKQYLVNAVVEIECVYYGPRQDSMKDLLVTTWAIGPLFAALTTTDPNVVVGYVQLRATIDVVDHGEPITLISRGMSAGDVVETSRKEALQYSASCAAWDLVYSLVERLAEVTSIRLVHRFTVASWEEYLSIIKSWVASQE